MDNVNSFDGKRILTEVYTKPIVTNDPSKDIDWKRLYNVPIVFKPEAHDHNDLYYSKITSDSRYVLKENNKGLSEHDLTNALKTAYDNAVISTGNNANAITLLDNRVTVVENARIDTASAEVNNATGTPSVQVTTNNHNIHFNFKNLKGIKGDKGDKGEQGDIGPRGTTGPQGPKGDAGATGPQGLTGPQGAIGPQGPKGDTGSVGPQGIQGPIGEKGDKGDKGEKGDTGPAGTTDYTQLSNKPKINNVELNGNKSLADLGIDIPTKTSQLQNDSNFLTEHQSLSAYRTSSAQDVIDSAKQDKIDSGIYKADHNVVNAINETHSIAVGANQSLSYGNISTLVSTFNALAQDVYNVGQNIYIVTREVPDVWISSREATSVPYTYVDDATFVSALSTNGYVQIGYYKISMLETQKVDLTPYRTASAQDIIDNGKQAKINDLDDIRSGASLGATALQSVPNTYRTSADQDIIDNSKAPKSKVVSISLSSSWAGETSPYTQIVTISGETITTNTKVDLQPNSSAIAQLIDDDVQGLYVENNNGVLTAYAIGNAPSVALTIQATLSEVTS